MTLEQRIAQIDAEPLRRSTCEDQAKWARVGKRAHFGLADDAHVDRDHAVAGGAEHLLRRH